MIVKVCIGELNEFLFRRGGETKCWDKMSSESDGLAKTGAGREGLSSNDYLFLIGLGAFIVYLVLVHPSTPVLPYQNLLFWMSVTVLFLSMAPDYVNSEVTWEWLKEYKNTKLGGFYRKVHELSKNSDKYLSWPTFLTIGSILAIAGFLVFIYTAEISELLYGIAWGAVLRGMLA